MPKTVAILQSNYIPWKGYFDLIARSDQFIFYDDLPFTKNDWRNRNQVMTRQGPRWLTIPCGAPRKRLICEVELPDPIWQKKHWTLISQEYGRAPCFGLYRPFLEEFYLGTVWTHLSEMNQHLIRHVAREFLKLETGFDDSRRYGLKKRKADRVMELLDTVGGVTEYVSGPAAKAYLEPAAFRERGIELTWMDYGGYPEYPQHHAPFVHQVSILDLLFQVGPKAREYMKHV
ncbi:MAG: WbqC family protein [Planctomycetota bacterium]